MKARLHIGKNVSRSPSQDAGIVVIVSVVLTMVALAAFSATLSA